MRAGVENVEVLGEVRAQLGEGPLWSEAENALYWVDVKGRALLRHFFDRGKTERFGLDEQVGCIVPRSSGGWLVALESGFSRIDHWNGPLHPLCDPESHLPGNRFNDGKVDAAGRLWAGTMDDAEENISGALYRLDPHGHVETMVRDLGISNGLGWSPGGRLFYLTDSTRRTIWVHDHDPASGALVNPRVFARVAEDAGWPDGLAIDVEGYLWSAHWDGWRLTRYAPDGHVDRVVGLPVPRPTSCAFGGAGMSTLFITSARHGLSGRALAAAPLSGAVLNIQSGTSGLPPHAYGG